ncbi:TIGR02391 family protein [Pseudovibrio sp. JE062]|uniref:TIGR02391 family protein n=1 Tax=Pseudovibrio sp. JE062 TaxID=439495 RepID=UPI000186C390|nr:TIGR02391 family protein [Pseudovibrio sp. JE062]EEA91785.1 conserved hypothetical protein TIGR02391 [Pseudovibrio sp. JE062]
MSLHDEMLALKIPRTAAAPFQSIDEFKIWADNVSPLLKILGEYETEFQQTVASVTVTHALGSSLDVISNMKAAVGILDRAIKFYELNGHLQERQTGLEHLLHPLIIENSLALYRGGNWREAVLNGVTSICDLIRERTGLNTDGERLITAAFSPKNPQLIFSEIDTESGQADQKGFMQILQGTYQGIRNPKAHTLNHDLDERKAIEYLILLSLLARRVSEAKAVQEVSVE